MIRTQVGPILCDFQAVNPNRTDLTQLAHWKPKHTIVPVVSLAEFIPCVLGGKFKRVEFLMCDAQGSDLSIMKAAGSALHYVDKVSSRPRDGRSS